MLLEILPAQLYDSPKVKVLFRDEKSSIFHKVLHDDLLDSEMYLSSAVILFIMKGRQIISNYDGKRVTVEKGDLLYLTKDMYLVSDFVMENSEFEAVIFFLGERFFEHKAINSIRVKNPGTTIPILPATNQVKKYVQSLLDVYSYSTNSNEILNLKLLELLALIRSQVGGDEFLSLFDSYLMPNDKRDIQEFMNSNYLKNLKVEDYALLTGRSKSTFIREFRTLYNTTPNQWLIEQRLNKAHKLLISTNLNVTNTAFEVGYENVSHFIDAYKKKFNITPKQSKNSSLTQISY